MKKEARVKELLLYPLPLAVLIIAWHFAVLNNQERQFTFSSPEKVLETLINLIKSGELLANSSITVSEALIGFLLGTTSGALLGLSLWYSRLAAKIARPYITALGTIPIFALSPIIISWFGIDMTSKVALAFCLR